MDIDFVRRGSLSLMERDHRVKQGLCLVCGKAGHRKANCPKSRFKFNSDSSKNIHAIQTEFMKQQDSGKPIQFPLRKQLSSARQPSNFDDLNMDMMKTVDSFASWDLAFGSAIHADTFFIDCGADDVFMDAELADRLNIPLVKIPVPIKLRLADGDSSSMITPSHSTPSVAYWQDMLKQLVSMSPVSAMGLFWIFWLEPHNPQINGNPGGWIWIQLLFEELLRWVDSDPRSWKASKNLRYLAKPDIRNLVIRPDL
ncbi:hypothetical protein BASA81_013639 [Batrachochytrium salamandrivorans]|nr:hypothetical protein BASA81_013639 [Batrachochytrium salamandrivorans]